MTPSKLLWLSVGLLALGLAALGVALPLLPTTPFLLLASFAFARSSERLHDWLIHHPTFGPLIHNWQHHGAISRRTKIVAIVSMAAILVLSIVMEAPRVVVLVQAVILSGVALFLLSRPLPPGGH